MTVALYARRKGWSLDEVTVHLRYFRIHAMDCAECETKEGYLDRVEWRIDLRGQLTGEQQERILQIAQRCPVHRTLVSTIDIRPPEFIAR
jgi:putative redox protein